MVMTEDRSQPIKDLYLAINLRFKTPTSIESKNCRNVIPMTSESDTLNRTQYSSKKVCF